MVEIHEEAGFGRIRLSRPEALGALTLDMVRTALEAVRRFQTLPSVRALWIESVSAKAFSAGGDVRALIENQALGQEFFQTEYALDQALHRYSKPVLALGQGLMLGGGFGLFESATHRIVSDSTQAAMPEIRIGFFPDVGASWFLGRLPKPIGIFLALTGSRLDATALLDLGLATHYVPENQASNLRGRPPTVPWKEDPSDDFMGVDQALESIARRPSPSPEWSARRKWIEEVFPLAGSTVPELLSFFKKHESNPDPWIAHAMKEGLGASPHSLELILRLFRETEGKRIEECFAIEEKFAKEATLHPDFAEGVRARLIEKGQRAPRWKNPHAT